MAFRKLFAGRQFALAYSGTHLSIPMHAHSEYVVGYFLEGRSYCRFWSSGCIEFCPGTLGLLNPGDSHEDLETPQDRQCLTVSLKGEFFQELAHDLGFRSETHPYFSVPKLECDAPLKRTFEALRDEIDGRQVGREVMITSLVTELGIQLLRRFHDPGLNLEKFYANRPLAPWRVRKALEYLSEHYSDEFNLGRVAEASGLSKYHLDRVFKYSTGLSPSRYVTNLRLDKAKHLLVSSPRPIADIAVGLGFSDQSHFTHVFKRFIGVTPKAYRRSAKE